MKVSGGAPKPSENTSNIGPKAVETWQESDVIDWFNSNSLNMDIFHRYKSHSSTVSGVQLKQLKEIYQISPEFVNNYLLADNSKLTLNDIKDFTRALNVLFKNSL